ncbi:MAG: sigma-70 family RNA polymerase sigma factor SigH [Gammaproteobacteria bacterium]|nr:MAG: sigma-70 family RNA polymerase sigma factor SigH [Gammaproteobacteria bacterium]
MRDPSDDIQELLQSGFRYALSLTHDASRAEDLLQEGWVSVLQAKGPHQRGYLFAAIRSRFIDACRRERRVVFEALTDANELGMEGDLQSTGSEAPVFADTATLNRALATLRPAEREMLFLADVQEYTAQEIADLTGRPRGTVLSLIHRAHRKLRSLLKQGEGGRSCRE